MISKYVGLEERIEINYVGYYFKAVLKSKKRKVLSGVGSTIENAIKDLNRGLKKAKLRNYEDVRKYCRLCTKKHLKLPLPYTA